MKIMVDISTQLHSYSVLYKKWRAIEKLSGHQFENYSFKISYIPDEERFWTDCSTLQCAVTQLPSPELSSILFVATFS
uniref:Uncharacterized protein n=1 Tax=Sphaerodactylus townsendi TaxID=933632 RepID=A0ACB8FAZ5_9SAUR